jgi:hypothetical protein
MTQSAYRRWEAPGGFEPGFLQEGADEISRLKDQLLEGLLKAKAGTDPRLQERYRWAADEAAALAFSTPWPRLFFPVLFAEKTAEARVRFQRQAEVYGRSGGRWTVRPDTG